MRSTPRAHRGGTRRPGRPSAATPWFTLAVRRVVDHGFSDDAGGLIDAYFAMLIVVVGALAVASALRHYLVITLGERVVADLRSAVFRHLTHPRPRVLRSGQDRRTRIAAHRRHHAGEIRLRGQHFDRPAQAILPFVGAIVLMVWTSPKLSALVLLAIPVIVLPLVVSGRAVRRRSRAAQDRLADASAYAAEAVGAVRTMQAFGMARATAERFAKAAEDAFEAARCPRPCARASPGPRSSSVSVSVVGVLWYGAQDVLSGTITAGRLSQFMLYAVFAASSLGQLSEVYGELTQAAGAAEQLGEILAAEPAVKPPAHPKVLPDPPLGTVAFEDVRFAYPTRAEQLAADGLTFAVASGERVALVGPSGAGKSTVFQLLLRFRPAGRRVLIDGVSVTAVDPAALRAPWPSCRRSRPSLRRASWRTSATAVRKPARRRSATRPSSPRRTGSYGPCRRATRRPRRARRHRCRAGSASASPSRARS